MRKDVKDCFHRKSERKNILGAMECEKVNCRSELEEKFMKKLGLSGS